MSQAMEIGGRTTFKEDPQNKDFLIRLETVLERDSNYQGPISIKYEGADIITLKRLNKPFFNRSQKIKLSPKEKSVLEQAFNQQLFSRYFNHLWQKQQAPLITPITKDLQFFEENGKIISAMSMQKGEDTTNYLHSHIRQTSEKISVLQQIARELYVTHKSGVIHRDLKETNVVLTPNEAGNYCLTKLIDFGTAQFIRKTKGEYLPGQNKLSKEKEEERKKEKTLIGTPSYFAPETISLREYNPKTDLFSLGVIAYNTFVPVGMPDVNKANSVYHLLKLRENEFQRTLEEAKDMLYSSNCPKPIAYAIIELLQENPTQRNAKQLMQLKPAEYDSFRFFF